ncbi:MAG: hypothetical protein KC519_18160, partial [Anaerolineae bacterium]|nr:hypothetical protein [Anaerolineae bacterium]
ALCALRAKASGVYLFDMNAPYQKSATGVLDASLMKRRLIRCATFNRPVLAKHLITGDTVLMSAFSCSL